MSREQKLALILGFLAVLVVAMLISDHYSKANSQRLAAEVSEAPQAIDPTMPSPYAGGSAYGTIAANTPPGMAPLPPTNVDQPSGFAGGGLLSDALRNADQGGGSLPVEPIVVTQGGDNTGALARDTSFIEGLRARGEEIANGMRDMPPAANTTFVPTGPRPSSPDQSNPDQAIQEVDTQALQEQLDDAARGNARPQAPAPAPAPAAERWHVVAANESLFAISKKYYGDGKHWQKLADANKNRLSGKTDVRVGVRLLIPDAAALGINAPRVANANATPANREQAKPEQTKPAPKASAPKAAQPKATPASATSGRVYEVKKGDTLGEIAMRELGTSKRASEILTLNNLSDANAIRVGQKLKLPSK